MRIKGWLVDAKSKCDFNVLKKIPKFTYDIKLSKIAFMTSDDTGKSYGIYLDVGGDTNICIITEDSINAKEILAYIETEDALVKKGKL